MAINFLDPHDSSPKDTLSGSKHSDIAQGNTPLLSAVRWFIFGIVALVPLFFLPFTSEVLEFNKQILLVVGGGMAFLLYLFDMVKEGRLFFRKTWIWYPLLGIVSALTLSTIFSVNVYRSVFGGFGSLNFSLISVIGYSMVAFLILAVFERREVRTLLYSFLGGSVVSVLFASLQLFKVHILPFGFAKTPSFNLIGTANSIGIVAAFLLTLGLALLYRTKGKAEQASRLKRYVYQSIEIGAVVLGLFWLVVLNWWVVWVVSIVGLMGVLGLQALKTGYRMRYYFVPMTIVVLAVFMMLTNFTLGIKNRLPVEVSLAHRTSFNITRQVFNENFVFGTGPESFSTAYMKHKPQAINNTTFWNLTFSDGSSEFMNTLIGSGIVGLTAILFLLGFPLYLLVRYLWTHTGSLREKGAKNLAVDIFPAFLVLATAYFLYPLNVTLSFALFFLFALLGLLFSTQSDRIVVELEKSPKYSLISSVSSVLVLIILIFGLYFGVKRYAGNINFVQAFRSDNPDTVMRKVVNAINMDKNEDLYPRALTNVLLVRINDELQKLQSLNQDKDGQKIQEAQGRIQNFAATAIDMAKRATDLHPKNPSNWFQRGVVYQNLIGIVGGAEDWSVPSFQEYSKLAPQDPQGYLRIGNVLLRRADLVLNLLTNSRGLKKEQIKQLQDQLKTVLSQAEENYKKSIEVKPDFAQAIYNLGVVFERQGRVPEAIAQLEITRQGSPFDSGVALQLGLLYYRNDRKDLAFNELQRAVRIFPDYSNALWYLALIHEERGEFKEALARLEHILELNPDNELVVQKIAQLGKGVREIPPEKVTGQRPL